MKINHEVHEDHEEKKEHSVISRDVEFASRFIWFFFVHFVFFVVGFGCIQ